MSLLCTGPGKAWTALEQGEFLFQLAQRKPSFIKVPVGLLDGIIGILDFVGRVVPQWEVRFVPFLYRLVIVSGQLLGCLRALLWLLCMSL